MESLFAREKKEEQLVSSAFRCVPQAFCPQAFRVKAGASHADDKPMKSIAFCNQCRKDLEPTII